MAKTKKTLLPKNLAKYDVYIEDRELYSQYFRASNLPQVFTGGRNSFLLGATNLLKDRSTVLIEILDSKCNPIFQKPVADYIEGTSRLITVEINNDTPAGVATIIVLGEATQTTDGSPVPSIWSNKYNVRWVRNILVEPNTKNMSPIRFIDTPQVTAEEYRFYNVNTSNFSTITSSFSASLTPVFNSTKQTGYLVTAVYPSEFTGDYYGAILTGSLSMSGYPPIEVKLPITNILNTSTAFSTGYVLTVDGFGDITSILLRSGSYTTNISNTQCAISSSTKLQYNKLQTTGTNIPISYAKLRVSNLPTVSGEIQKAKIYTKISTELSDYKLSAEVPLLVSELLTSSSIRGDVSLGNFVDTPNVQDNWYSDILATSTDVIYPISGSNAYYTSNLTNIPLSLYITSSVLLNSMYANVPINSNAYSGSFASVGYFIGTKRPITLFQTSEYTLKLNAYYKNTSGSAILTNNNSSVDIYIIGTNGTIVYDKNPLGQKIATLTVPSTAQTKWFEAVEFNFVPKIINTGTISVRIVVPNGFWYFSNISIVPATDSQFSPDEAEFYIPNTTYNNALLQHKIQFLDINSNTADITAVSTPTYFTGSVIDFGILP